MFPTWKWGGPLLITRSKMPQLPEGAFSLGLYAPWDTPRCKAVINKKNICKVPNTRYVQCKLTVSVVMLSKRLSRLMGCFRAVLFIYLGSLTLEHFECPKALIYTIYGNCRNNNVN